MTENERKKMYENIVCHGENLRKIFHFSGDVVPVCKKLLTLENKANKLMVDFCNGFLDVNTLDYATEKVYNTLLRILSLSHSSPLAKELIINRDARGYTLKIAESFIRENRFIIYRDFGGYGILAPDFRINKPLKTE
jgi:hypothetical protein